MCDMCESGSLVVSLGKQRTAYGMRISDWSSDLCSSDLLIAIKADVAKPKAGEKIVEQTTQKLGRLDILVNNAGEQHPAADIRDIDEDQLQRTFATNIFGMRSDEHTSELQSLMRL